MRINRSYLEIFLTILLAIGLEHPLPVLLGDDTGDIARRTTSAFTASTLSVRQPPALEWPIEDDTLQTTIRSTTNLRFEHSSPIVLTSSDTRFQLLLARSNADGSLTDATRDADYQVQPTGIVDVDTTGFVVPLAPGRVTVIALDPLGGRAECSIEVAEWSNASHVDFANQIVPVFTKHGCNGGGCHGKAAGQNGFKLSLLGFEPNDDYARIVHESRGRRVSLAAPTKSLLLMKATGTTPHGGGAKIQEDSHDYRLLRRWIEQGCPRSETKLPTVIGLRIEPSSRIMQAHAQQQIAVYAVYSNGMTEDVTRTSQFESNDIEMAEVDEQGKVQVKGVAGKAAIMARYQGKVAVFQAAVPMESSYSEWPVPNNAIDSAVMGQLRALRIPMSSDTDDATFLRRVTLDLCGRLPTLEESKNFLSSTDAEKRNACIERLLESDGYAEFFANKWMVILRNRRNSPGQQAGSFAFHRWLKASLAENKPYDEFVRDILAASGDIDIHPPVAWYRNVSDTFSRTEDAAQLFLGQRLQCARCHHHPYEKWSQEDYYRFAAFFSLLKTKPGPTQDDPRVVSEFGQPTMPHPRTGQGLSPAGLDSEPQEIHEYEDPRERLVDWMVQADNPFFAKSLVNRYWKHFLGRGLVEPEDDLRSTNPPSNPELMDVLSKSFIDSRFDLKALIRQICQSRVYQLSHEANGKNLSDYKCYSRYYPKRLPAEVLLDAIDDVTESQTAFDIVPAQTRAVSLPDTAFDSYFLTVFGRPSASTACECERESDSSLAQSLQLANSKELQAKIGSDSARPARLARMKNPSKVERIDELYLAAYSRYPTQPERSAANAYLETHPDQRTALEDLTWALINSKEFLFNH